jgi:hypothetical protein
MELAGQVRSTLWDASFPVAAMLFKLNRLGEAVRNELTLCEAAT